MKRGYPAWRVTWGRSRVHDRRTGRTIDQSVIAFRYQDSSNMANPNKRKGDAAEREIAGLLSDALNIRIRRKLGAGRQDDTGDLDGLPDCTAQVKNYADIARAIREGLAVLEQQQKNSGTIHGVLFVRRRGGEWIAVQTLDQFTTMFRETL